MKVIDTESNGYYFHHINLNKLFNSFRIDENSKEHITFSLM